MDIESFKSGFIKQVNKYRNNHGAGNLKSDSNIDEIAQQFAERLCKKDELFYIIDELLIETHYLEDKIKDLERDSEVILR